MLTEGDAAPDFSLPDQDGESVSLSDLEGKTTVLYFYPRADTPGCTKQACGVRDREADYEAAGARVIGISPDPVDKVARFADKHSLGFMPLADADHSVAEAFGTWVEKSMYGKRYWGSSVRPSSSGPTAASLAPSPRSRRGRTTRSCSTPSRSFRPAPRRR